MRAFSRGFKWVLAGFLILITIPFILDFLSVPVLTYRGDAIGQYRDFRRYAQILDQRLRTTPATNSLRFPDMLQPAVDLRRAQLFATFSDIPNVRTVASSTVICTSKNAYRDGKLVLLRDGTVSFMRDDGSLVPYRNK